MLQQASTSRFKRIAAYRPELLGDVYRGETAPTVSRTLAPAATEPAVQPLLPSMTVAGKPVTVEAIDADAIMVRTSMRLCPGRQVSVRVGRAKSTAMVVMAARVATLKADQLVYVARPVPARSELASQVGP